MDYNFYNYGISIGPCLSVGIGSVNSAATDDSVTFVLSGGVNIEFQDVPVGIEFGYIQGFSSNESLKGGNRDDGAIYIGINFEKLIKKMPIKKF